MQFAKVTDNLKNMSIETLASLKFIAAQYKKKVLAWYSISSASWNMNGKNAALLAWQVNVLN